MEEETKIFHSVGFSGCKSRFETSSKSYEHLDDVSNGGVRRRKLYKCNERKTYDNNIVLSNK